MNTPGFGLRLVAVLTGLASLAHLVRLFRPFPIHLGSHAIPLWSSGLAFVVLAVMAWWFWKLARQVVPPTQPVSPPSV